MITAPSINLGMAMFTREQEVGGELSLGVKVFSRENPHHIALHITPKSKAVLVN